MQPDYIILGQQGINVPATVHGGGGNDTIDGGEKADKLYGEAGNDVIVGWGGNDSIYGGSGNDTLGSYWHETGNDYIDGQTGNNNINGGPGNDTVHGGDGNDTISGYTGNDSVKRRIGRRSLLPEPRSQGDTGEGFQSEGRHQRRRGDSADSSVRASGQLPLRGELIPGYFRGIWPTPRVTQNPRGDARNDSICASQVVLGNDALSRFISLRELWLRGVIILWHSFLHALQIHDGVSTERCRRDVCANRCRSLAQSSNVGQGAEPADWDGVCRFSGDGAGTGKSYREGADCRQQADRRYCA